MSSVETHAPPAEVQRSYWQRWWHQPQRLWLRRAIFQIHLWSGLILSVYLIAVCISGSAIVFRNDIYEYLNARKKITPQGTALKGDALRARLAETFPGWDVKSVDPPLFEDEAAEITFTKDGSEKTRLVNPYTGADHGAPVAAQFRVMRWFGELHGKLLLEDHGLEWNGVGGFLTAIVCFSGLVIWWPGVARAVRAMFLTRGVGWKRFNFDLHSAAGFWIFAFLLMWGLTGASFVFPAPFRATVNFFTPINPPPGARPPQPAAKAAPGSPPQRRPRRPLTLGGKIVRGFSYAHYGNFAGWPVKLLWVVLGLVPVVLFITGVIMWWNRVLGPMWKRLAAGG